MNTDIQMALATALAILTIIGMYSLVMVAVIGGKGRPRVVRHQHYCAVTDYRTKHLGCDCGAE